MIYDYIEKYALAQSILGVDKTIEIKNRVIGKMPLAKARIHELDRIIRLLRKQYLRSEFYKGSKNAKTNRKKSHRKYDKMVLEQ
jgi:hypothetical protein